MYPISVLKLIIGPLSSILLKDGEPQALALLGEAGAEGCPSLRACASSRCLSSRHPAPFLLTAAGRRALRVCSTGVN